MGCTLHTTHSPVALEEVLQEHHVWPLSFGGPDSGEKMLLCPTGHLLVHAYLRALYHEDRGDRLAPPDRASFNRHFGWETRLLANRGFLLWVAAGKPPVRL